jgi:hypothetical protein
MLFMVIETLPDPPAVYRRFKEKGRQVPPEVRLVDSWIEASGKRCFQVMECADLKPLMEWVAAWRDIVDFEIIPVVPSRTAAEIFGPRS